MGLFAALHAFDPWRAELPVPMRPVTLVSPPSTPSPSADPADIGTIDPTRRTVAAEAELREPPIEAYPEDLQELVRTHGLDEQAPSETERIAARDAHADVEARTIVTADRPGERTPRSEGDGEDGWADAVGLAREGASQAAGGGRAGSGEGVGAPGNGDRLESGPAAPIGSWAPDAFRWAPDGQRAERPDEGGRPSPTRAPQVAHVDATGTRSDRGGSEEAPSDDAATPGTPTDVDGAGPAPAPGFVDPVQDLRDALGWGPIDRARLAARPAWADGLGSGGRAPSSPQTVFDTERVAWTPAVNARGTPLGAYVTRLEDIVAARWRDLDLDLHDRAVGIQGEVAVRYVVHRSGAVSDVTVARSSGHPTLDAMARAAVPSRLPRFPSELEEEQVFHEVVLGYRNPQIVTTGPLGSQEGM